MISNVSHHCRILISVVLAATCITGIAPAQDIASTREPELREGDTVAFIGDSITQARMYSVLMETYLLVCQPTEAVEGMNFGWSGETAEKLVPRMDNDVLWFQPEVATLSYGMNDGRYKAYNAEYADQYRAAISEITDQLKRSGTRYVLIGSPGCVDPADFDRCPPEVYNDTLRRFGEIARQVAEEQEMGFADVHNTMIAAMNQAKAQFGSQYRFVGNDGFHPQWGGHMVMAYAYLKALIGDYEVGRITLDYGTGEALSSEGHTVVSSNDGTVEIESTRYPFCFFGDDQNPDGTRSAATLVPFNQELNRFMLVVENAPDRCLVTWGDASKEFSADELANGINLAAEFMDRNPFYDPFIQVWQGVRDKQTYEIHMIKRYVTNVPVLERILPQEADAVSDLTAALTQERLRKQAELADLVTPVRHRIQVAPAESRPDDGQVHTMR